MQRGGGERAIAWEGGTRERGTQASDKFAHICTYIHQFHNYLYSKYLHACILIYKYIFTYIVIIT